MILQIHEVGNQKSWVAKLVGRDLTYFFKREFINGNINHMLSTRDCTVKDYDLGEQPAVIYQVGEPYVSEDADRQQKGVRKYYCRIIRGQLWKLSDRASDVNNELDWFLRWRETGALPEEFTAWYRPALEYQPEPEAQMAPHPVDPAPQPAAQMPHQAVREYDEEDEEIAAEPVKPERRQLIFLENDAGDVLRWNPASKTYDCVTREYEDDELKL